jgi:hypothetical protein
MLNALFGRGSFLGEDLEPWCLDTWAWMMRNLGGMGRLRDSPLITPSRDFFPPSEATGHDRAIHVFSCVRYIMGMADWHCELEAYERPQANAQVGEFWLLRTPNAPNGTFQVKDNTVRISYAADLVDNPAALVATFAHELCHYLLATVPEPSPGGPDTHELDTDLAVAYVGFGVFAANNAFSFSQHGDSFSQGWRSQRNGYLSERSWAFALALFLRLKGEPAAADKWLKPGLAAEVAKADRYLAKHPALLEPLEAIG